MIWAGLPFTLSRKHVNKNKSVAKSDQNPCNFDKNTHNFLYRENDLSIAA